MFGEPTRTTRRSHYFLHSDCVVGKLMRPALITLRTVGYRT
jgi:hypothetical protein